MNRLHSGKQTVTQTIISRTGRWLLLVGLTLPSWHILPLTAQHVSVASPDASQINTLKAQELVLIATLVEDFPERVDPLVLLGNSLYRHGQGEKALEVWHSVLERDPQRADIYDTLGNFAMKRGQYETALQHWRKALAIDPNMSGIHGSLARALIGLGQHPEAVQALEKDIEISPRSSPSHFLLGKLHLQAGRSETAEKHYQAAIRLNPQHSNAYYGLFTVHTRLKDTERAQAYLNTFKQLKAREKQARQASTAGFDDLTKVRKDLAQTYAQAYSLYKGKGQIQRAISLLQQAAKYDPPNTLYLATLATQYQEAGQLSQALAVYEQISQLAPRDARAFLNMERLLIKLGRPAEAEAALLKVVKLLPEQAIGYRELALLYLRAGKHLPRALELARKAVSLEPTAQSSFIQGWALEKNGQLQEAGQAYQRAAQLDPDHAPYRRAYERVRSQERP